jgi:lipid II isoglutaminyl synthase (glutamine-hydrolysing)
MKTLRLGHFYRDELNLYGDGGNVAILQKRCEWRGLQLEVEVIESSSEIDFSTLDLFFIGGASDREQALVTEDLQKIRHEFKAAIEDGVGGLTICGGYQFLGEYYQLHDGTKLKGLGILDFYTENRLKDSTDVKKRLIGDLHVVNESFGRIVGYENHAGQTFHQYPPLGEVINGYGNNKKDKKEGLLYKNLIGTYMHGPLLSKNPRVADHLLINALERKYGKGHLPPLDDEFSRKANKQIWNRCIS